jgi:DNA-binding MarR family transcriptional regulator
VARRPEWPPGPARPDRRRLSDLPATGFDDFTPARGRIAARIAPGGTRLTDLAEQALVTKQTAGHLVDQLERAGFVHPVPDPTDKLRAALERLREIADPYR